jgi:signal peptide peptidase SppA
MKNAIARILGPVARLLPAERPHRAPFRESFSGAEALALDARIFARIGAPGAWQTVPRKVGGIVCDVPEPLRFYPEAFDDDWGHHEASILDGGVAVLNLCGPIEHHSSFYWHSYEDLAKQVEAALSCEQVRALVLKVDSPGGVAAGMGENHKNIRRIAKTYGKRVIAYLDEMACSAAYHASSACSEIWLPESAQAGSVGVIMCTVDESAMLDAAGIKVRYVVTGERKADLHPGQPVTDDVLKVAQEHVDTHGAMFFGVVAKARAGAGLDSPDKVKALQAAVFIGEDAVRVGLADGVASWPDFLTLVRGSLGADPSRVQVPAAAPVGARRAAQPLEARRGPARRPVARRLPA